MAVNDIVAENQWNPRGTFKREFLQGPGCGWGEHIEHGSAESLLDFSFEIIRVFHAGGIHRAREQIELPGLFLKRQAIEEFMEECFLAHVEDYGGWRAPFQG